jgi:hypothetical protein
LQSSTIVFLAFSNITGFASCVAALHLNTEVTTTVIICFYHFLSLKNNVNLLAYCLY